MGGTSEATNYSNAQINAALEEGKRSWRRVGSCRDCNGRCCNFVVMAIGGNGAADYLGMHGQRMRDKWIPSCEYAVVPASCQQCIGTQCHVFNTEEMPMVCRQFPVNPWDFVWRYLKQIGTPCGFDFVDAETDEPWNMRRTEERWGQPVS